MTLQSHELSHLVAVALVGAVYVGAAIHADWFGEIKFSGGTLHQSRHPWIFGFLNLARLSVGCALLLFVLWRFAAGPFHHP